MGTTLSDEMLKVIDCLANNNVEQAKIAALEVCRQDESKRNRYEVKRFEKLLENRTETFLDVPFPLKGLLEVQDIKNSRFRPERYYLDPEREELFNLIKDSLRVSGIISSYGIPYLNSTLIYGEPGTGKTEFAKTVAARLDLPFAYVNFSYLIDSLLGKTSQNIQKVFDYIQNEKCVLLLDEIDCIGLKRGRDGGADGELGRTTIALMQCLDRLNDGQIIIGATNRYDRLDPALSRRFQRAKEFTRYDAEGNRQLVLNYLDDLGLPYAAESVETFVSGLDATQATIVQHINDCVVRAISCAGGGAAGTVSSVEDASSRGMPGDELVTPGQLIVL